MPFRLTYRRYRLPLRAAVRTAHGQWTDRDGLLVRLEADDGRIGFGEIAPIPWFGTETADEAEAVLRDLGVMVNDARLASVPERFGCVRNGMAAALAAIARLATEPAVTPAPEVESGVPRGPGAALYLPMAALLPAGPAAIAQIAPKAEAGFRVFKWKVGVGDAGDELALLDDLCAELPDGAKLRLDANGAWDRRRAERWLERCAERRVEFVEQPCFTAASQGATQQRRTEDLLLGLAGDYPTPIALDESLVGNGDIERWIAAGWPGVFVIKPSLVGDPSAAIARLAKAKADVVFSSALETAVGARAALELAFAWAASMPAMKPADRRALGFGVWPLFADSRFDGPYVAPFLRAEDVGRLDPEAVWNALS